MRIDRLDHLVLTVADIATTVDFYTRCLGMRAVTFGTGRTALTFGISKINLHQTGQEFEPKSHRPTPGSADPTESLTWLLFRPEPNPSAK